jgi:hypothetical protein
MRSVGEVFVVGDLIYVAGPGGLHVIDVSTPSEPRPIGYVPLDGVGVAGVAVQGDYAYAATWGAAFPRPQLHVIDVSDPTQPVTIASVITESGRVAVSRGCVYVASQGWGTQPLLVFDVSTPTSPFLVAYSRQHMDPMDVVTSEGYVYVAAGGMKVFEEYGYWVFSDGFESGDISAWSSAVP